MLKQGQFLKVITGAFLFLICLCAFSTIAYADQDTVSLTIKTALLQKSDDTSVFYPLDIHLKDVDDQEVSLVKKAETITADDYSNGVFGEYSANVAAGTYTYDAYNHETSVKLGSGTIVVAEGQTVQEETLSVYMFGGSNGNQNITNPDKVSYTLSITGPDGTTNFPTGESGLTAVLPAREGANDGAYTYAFVPENNNYWGSSGQLWVYSRNSVDYFAGLNLSDNQISGFLIAPKTTIQLQVESGASARIAHMVRFYRPMEYINGSVVKTENGIDTWEFVVPKYYKFTSPLHYEVRKEGKITQAKTFDPTEYADKKQTLVVPTLKDDPTTQKKDATQDFCEASILLNGSSSKMVSMDAGDTFDIWASRTWQPINNIAVNYYVDPDFHYNLVSGDSVSIREDGRVIANKSGVSVVQITYDALEYQSAFTNLTDGNGLMVYSATWPERTGVLVFNVGDSNEANIDMNIGLTEFDTLYFAKTVNGESKDSYAEHSFTPTADQAISSVRVQKPLQTNWEDGWESYTPDQNGAYTVKFYEGPNIIEVKSGNSAQYHVAYASGLDVNMKNAAITDRDYFMVGDTAIVSFEGLVLPMPKLGAVYNPGYPAETYVQYNIDGKSVEAQHSQYQVRTTNNITVDLTEQGTLKLTDGKIHTSSIGEVPTQHQNLTKESMVSNYSNYGGGITPETFDGYLCKLPDIDITVEETGEKSDFEKLNYIAVKSVIDYSANYEQANPMLGSKATRNVFNSLNGLGNAEYSPTVLTSDEYLLQNMVLWDHNSSNPLLKPTASSFYTCWKDLPNGISTTLRYWSTMEGHTTPKTLELENGVMAQTEVFAGASDIAYLEYICSPDEGVEAYPKTYTLTAHKKDGDSYGKLAYLYGLDLNLKDGSDDASTLDSLLHANKQGDIDFGYGFLGTETEYTATVPFSTTQISFTPTALEEGTTVSVEVNGQTVENKSESQVINIEGQYTEIPVKVTVSDGADTTYDTKTYTIRVERRNSAPKIVTKTLEHASVDAQEAYSAKLEATGLPDTFTWTLTGELPSGLSFNADTATISGTPAAGTGGQYNISATATNSEGSTTRDYTLVVDENPRIDIDSLPNAYVGSEYSFDVDIAGYPEVSVFADGLPEGLTFNTETLEITGTATTTGAYEVKISADSTLGHTEKTLTLLVSTGKWSRLEGESRIDTMSAIVGDAFSEDNASEYILVASSDGYADALSASALAGVLDAPVVTTSSNELSEQSASQIKRLANGKTTVYVIGGSEAVSDETFDQIGEIVGVDKVERLAGTDRVSTGLEILEACRSEWSDTYVITNAWGYADALSSGAYASNNAAPIFGTTDGVLTSEQASAIRWLGFNKVVILGGNAAVDADQVKAQIGEDKQYVVLAGDTRIETSRAIVEWECGLDTTKAFAPENVLPLSNIAVSYAGGYADAPAGVNLSTQQVAPVLLLDESEASVTTIDTLIKANKLQVLNGRILGGSAAVSTTVEGWLNDAVAPDSEG